MNVMRKTQVATGLAVLVGCAGSGLRAEPLVFDRVSAQSAAQQIGDKYGVNIVLKGDFGTSRSISFSVPDGDMPGARLEVLTALANAVGADFTKTYVVSKVREGQDVPAAQIDTRGPIVFPSVSVPAQQAISMIAAADDATAQFPVEIGGSVTLSATQLGAESAAQEIATQTRTRWKVFYAMTPHSNAPRIRGKVIGRTSSGAPITELPFVYYKHLPTAAERLAMQKEAEASQPIRGMGPQPMDNPQMLNNGYPMNGYDPNGYSNPGFGDPYGSGGYNYGNPSGYGGYGQGYPGGNGGYVSDGSGLIVGTGNAYGGGPIVFQRYGY